MPELSLAEMLAWPALLAGFAWHFRGRRAAAGVLAAAVAAMIAAVWLLSYPASRNRALLAETAETLAWGAGIAVPVLGYALLIRRARRAARERDE